MRNYIYTITIIFCVAQTGYTQTESESLIGQKVPDLIFGQIMNHDKQQAKLSDYRGKVVILDFWATWCAPCIKAFPHLEGLKEKYSGTLEVLTITSDDRERIERFLNKKTTTLPIVLDPNRTLAKQFPHRTIPHTIVIDPEGFTRVISSADEITNDVIQDILDKKTVNLEEKSDNITWNSEDHLSAADAIFQFTLTPYKGGSAMMTNFENGRILFNGIGTRFLLEYANEFPPSTRTLFEVQNKDKYDPNINKGDRYSLEIIAPGKTEDEVRSIMLDFLHRTLPLRSRIEKRKVQVKVLQRTDGPLKIKESEPGSKGEFWFSGRGLHMQNRPLNENFIRFFENMLAKKDHITVVVNETGLTGNYDVDIPWYNEDPDNIHKELKKLGLQLVDGEREVDLLILYEKPNANGFN